MLHYISKIQEEFNISYFSHKNFNPMRFYEFHRDETEISRYNTILNYALEIDRMDIVNSMIDKGANEFRLSTAVESGKIENVKFILNINKKNNLNDALCCACRGGYIDIIELLIEKGANTFDYALRNAAEGGHFKILKMILNKGATITGPSIVAAVRNNHFEIIDFLIKNFNFDKHMREIMFAAAESGNMDILNLMIEKGCTYFNDAAFHAAKTGKIEIIKHLVEKGAEEFNHIMYKAVYKGHIDIVKLMIEKGAKNFEKCLYISAECGYIDIVNLLIEQGATKFDYALESAARGGELEIIKLLLTRGTSIEIGTTNITRSIENASEEGHTEIVKFFVEHFKGDIHVSKNSLYFAKEGKYFETVNYLNKLNKYI